MGKIKIQNKEEAVEKEIETKNPEVKETPATIKIPKKKITAGTLHIEATFNNTKANITDKNGNVLYFSSSGALGFRGAKKGTPFAASKVGETLGDKTLALGIKEVDVIIKGVGPGREPTVRGFMSRGFEITGIRDMTPIPHNGVKAKKPRRV